MTSTVHLNVKPGNGSSFTLGIPPRFLLWGALILVSILIAILNVILYGSTGATIGLVGGITFLGLTILRPHLGLVVFVFLGLAIEQFPKDYAWTKEFEYFNNLGNVFLPLRGIPINPLEIVLTLIIAGVLLRIIVLRVGFVSGVASKALPIYLVALIFFVGYGLSRGGDFLPALWEVRGIFYMGALMVLIPQLIHTEAEVKHVVWAVIAGVGFRAIEISYHYVAAGFSFVGSPEGWGSHEDAGWWSVMITFCIAMFALKARGAQRLVLSLLMLPTVLAILGSDRRTAYPVLAATLIFFVMVQSGEVQKKILRVAWKLALVFVIYLGVFWNSPADNILLMPVRNIREGLSDEQAKKGDSYTSNLYRWVENYDLARMTMEQPVLGAGFGAKINYYLPIPILWDLGFYIAHNAVLCQVAKTGFVGLTIFLFFYFTVLGDIAFGIAKIKDNQYLKAVLVLAGAAVTNHLLYGFFDITLTWYRSNIFVGTLIGVAGAINAIARRTTGQAEVPIQSPKVNVDERLRGLLQAPGVTSSSVSTPS